MEPKVIDCGGKPLELPAVMGILNVTPDSFSDGGRFDGLEAAVAHALAMEKAGAGIVDIGGESTRPGAEAVSLEQEMDRVIPVIEAVAARSSLPMSIDTSKPEVMRAAVEAGAGFINDVQALVAPGAMEAAAELGVPVCLMHMRGEPGTMQENPVYDDVVAEIHEFLADRVGACEAAGIPRERLLVDPGFGFGKTLDHNLELLRRLDEFAGSGVGLLVGFSRKSMFQKLLGRGVDERLSGSLAAALLALGQGADIVRVHDVAETVDAVRVWRAIQPV